MNLHLMRHGIAEPLGEGNQFLDFNRALTSEGQQKVLEVSKGLKKLQVNFQLVASSPHDFRLLVQSHGHEMPAAV